MNESTEDASSTQAIDLAREPDFELGALRVRPANCEVESNGASQVLQRRVMQVLVVLAHARGSVVSQDDLVARCWRGLAVTDDAIFRCISRLRKLAGSYADAPFAIETIPGVGYRLTSFNFTLIEPSTDTAKLPGKRSSARAVAMLAGVLILLFIVAGAIWLDRTSAGQGRPMRVVVQPFEALDRSDNALSLSRRVPNQIVNALGDSQIESMLAGEQIDTQGPTPGLAVTGILHDDGHHTTVDVRIEDGASHAALWSTEFKRKSGESSDLPVEVAARVADVVSMIGFARSANPPLTDDAALTALLQTNDMLRSANDDTWAGMLENARDLASRHPEFAFGHDLLAAAYAEASDRIDVPERAQSMRDAAQREANLTLKLDPQDAGAYVILSGLVGPYDHRRREGILLRGIRYGRHPRQPFAALYSYEGLLLGNVGRLREALSFQLVAHAADEWGPPRLNKLALAYANMGNLTAAKSALQKAVQLWPNQPGVWKAQQYVAGSYESPSEALAVLRALDARSSLVETNAIWRAFVEARSARSRRLTSATIQSIRTAGDQGKITRENEIMMLAALGETDQALDAAKSSLDRQELEPWFLFTPMTRKLRQDPRFIGLAERMGLIDYWRETGKRPDFCTGQTAQSECSPQLLAALNSR